MEKNASIRCAVPSKEVVVSGVCVIALLQCVVICRSFNIKIGILFIYGTTPFVQHNFVSEGDLFRISVVYSGGSFEVDSLSGVRQGTRTSHKWRWPHRDPTKKI